MTDSLDRANSYPLFVRVHVFGGVCSRPLIKFSALYQSGVCLPLSWVLIFRCSCLIQPHSPSPTTPKSARCTQVEKKMRSMAKENAALRARIGEAERARDRADAESLGHREELRRLTEQRDNLLLGASRIGGRHGLATSSPAETLAELLAAAAAGAVADATDVGPGAEEGELEAQLEQARSEAKLARVAAQQERLRREAAAREKEEAVRQLHRLMGAARRAVGRRDSRLKSSRMETEVVWNALTEAVR